MNLKKLPKFFNPSSVAVIGASDKPHHVGYSLMKNLFGGKFKGKIFPVNPNRKRVHGIDTYPSILDIPSSVDLVLIATPSQTVPKIIEECGKKGVGGVVIISSGFKEAGTGGKALYHKIRTNIRKYKLNVLGPNCLGFIRPSINLNASFSQTFPKKGGMAFISQSGALCSAILDWSLTENIGFSYFISIGEMIDIDFTSLLSHLQSDPSVTSILLYMESLSNGQEFLRTASLCVKQKPIIVLKAGISEAGSKAARSHTGNLAGNDAVFDAAFKKAGVLRVSTIEELFDAGMAFDTQPVPKGNRLTIVTNAGGPGVIATDHLITHGGALTSLSKKTMEKLDTILPKEWSHNNPVDLLGDADETRYLDTLELIMNDSNTDGVLTILTPQEMTNALSIARSITTIKEKHTKPFLTAFMGGTSVIEGKRFLQKHTIPCYQSPEDAVESFLSLYRFSTIKNSKKTIAHQPLFIPLKQKNEQIIREARRKKRTTLTEYEAKQMLIHYDIPIPRHSVATTEKEAVMVANNIGYPVVMKINSPDILHKTEAGGYILNIQSEQEVKTAFTQIIASCKTYNPKAIIDGVLIEEMVKKQYELLLGSKVDAIFGPVVVFGSGGTLVELYKDTNIGILPLDTNGIENLIEGTKIYQLLKGYRKQKGINIHSLEFLIYKFCRLITDFPEINQIDINPLAIDERGGVVLDAKIILSP